MGQGLKIGAGSVATGIRTRRIATPDSRCTLRTCRTPAAAGRGRPRRPRARGGGETRGARIRVRVRRVMLRQYHTARSGSWT